MDPTERNLYETVLRAKEAELSQGLHKREGLAAEAEPDVDTVQPTPRSCSKSPFVSSTRATCAVSAIENRDKLKPRVVIRFRQTSHCVAVVG